MIRRFNSPRIQSQLAWKPKLSRFRPSYELLEDRLTPALTLLPAILPVGVAGTLYSQSITASGGSPGDTYTYSQTGQLPVGMTLSSTGQLAGNPGQTGSFPITVTAVDNNQPDLTGSQSYTLTIGLGFLATNLTPGTVGSPYSSTTFITPYGGSGKYSFTTAWSNNLGQSGTGGFAGLTVSSTSGQIAGTPTSAGLYTLSITAKDEVTNLTAVQTVLVSIGLKLSVTTNPAPTTGAAANVLPALTVGTNYTSGNSPVTFNAAGGAAGDTYQYSMVGTVPGMSISAGQLVGIPTTPGLYSFTVIATDQNHPQLTGSQRYTISVAPNSLQVAPGSSTLPVATAGADYAQSFFATGGSGSYTFTQTGLPTGRFPLKLSTVTPSGTLSPNNAAYAVLSGTPGVSNAGTYPFTLTVTDSQNPSLSIALDYSITIDALTIAITGNAGASTLPAATVGQAYASQSVTASGGTGPYTYAATGLPSFLTFSPSGELTANGLPTQPGLYDIVFTSTDSSATPKKGTQKFPLVVFPAASPASLGGGALTLSPANPLPVTTSGDFYSQMITASGGGVGDTYTFRATGPLPTGLSLQSNGLLSGVATVPGTYNFSVVATDNFDANLTGRQQYTLVINPKIASPTSIALAPLVLPPGKVDYTYQPPLSSSSAPDYQLTASGGTGSYTYSSSGTLPPGIVLASNGLFVGTQSPTTVSAASNGVVLSHKEFTINVASTAGFPSSGTLVILTGGGQASVSYSGLTATSFTGCTTRYTYTLATGDVVYGEGVPTKTGTYAFSVTVTDSDNHSTTQPYNITILPSPTSYYSVQQVRQAYGLNNIILSGGIIGDGTGQTIAIIAIGDDKSFVSSTDPNYVNSDLHKFNLSMGLPDPPLFLKLDQYGGTNYPSKSYSDDGETSQDVEWVHALAPGANIILFEAPEESSDIAIQTALNYPGVTVITYSYGNSSNAGSNESTGETSTDYLYLAPAGKNVTFVNASGDNKGVQYPVAGTTYPSPNPYVLAAGMSTMISDAQGNYLGELTNTSPYMPTTANQNTGINIPNYGPSTYEAQPSYQAGIVPTSNSIPSALVTSVSGSSILVNTTANFPSSGTLFDQTTGAVITYTGIDYTPGDYKFKGFSTSGTVNAGDTLLLADSSGTPLLRRSGPDVSFNGTWATGAAGLTNGSWGQANGTSLAAPSWAALIAIANQGRALAGLEPLSGPVDTLPMLYNLPASDFNKITYQYNGTQSVGNATFNQSGLGSPIANRLVPGLVGGHNTISGQVIANGIPGAGWTIYLSSTAGAPLTPQQAIVTTDVNGYYSFLVAPGTYYVNAMAPAGGGSGGQSSNPVTFTPGADNVHVVNFSIATTPNQDYVNNVYQLLLGRSADAGASFWVNLLNNGASPSSVVLSIQGSSEYLSLVVNALYEHYLDRPADAGGLASWTAVLSGGTTIESVTASIVGSSEYFTLVGNTNTAYVTSLYTNILGRTGSEAEIQSWVNQIQSGTSPTQVATTFLTSTEYRTDLITGGPTTLGTFPYAPNWEGYYPEFLGRQADPDGLAVWLTAMANGATDQQVLASIFGSPEGYSMWS
jgi:hypothetical protein